MDLEDNYLFTHRNESWGNETKLGPQPKLAFDWVQTPWRRRIFWVD